ncbi:MAG: hypothetical protein KAQ92_05615 [Candidatus Aenigmarchaeota archaeon]|nr:hypothetical protein [Candidatus Aenigmarchaeota archaeon]
MVKKAISDVITKTAIAILFTIVAITMIMLLLSDTGNSVISRILSFRDYFVCMSGEGGNKAMACLNILKAAFLGG